MLYFRIMILFVSLVPISAAAATNGSMGPANWPWRGISITSSSVPSVEDISYLSSIGVNMINIRLDTRLTARRYGLDAEDALRRDLRWAERILDACKMNGLVAILSMSQVPIDPALGITQESHDYWADPERLEDTLSIVRRLAEHFKNRGVELAAYAILTEPVERRNNKPRLPDEWPWMMKSIVKTIRSVDGERYVLITPGLGGLPQGFTSFVPLDDPRIIYHIHMYVPHAYTHQGIHGRPSGITYPGVINGRYWNKDRLEAYLSPAVDFARRYDTLMLVDEFSAVRWAPGSEKYLGDLISLFNEYGWGWSYFQYKSYHGWDPDYSAVFSSDRIDEWAGQRIGKKSKRWQLLIREFGNASKER